MRSDRRRDLEGRAGLDLILEHEEELRVLARSAGELVAGDRAAGRVRQADEQHRHVAIRVGRAVQASGKLGDAVVGIFKVVFDAQHICDAGPLYPALAVPRMKVKSAIKAKHMWSPDELRDLVPPTNRLASKIREATDGIIPPVEWWERMYLSAPQLPDMTNG